MAYAIILNKITKRSQLLMFKWKITSTTKNKSLLGS